MQQSLARTAIWAMALVILLALTACATKKHDYGWPSEGAIIYVSSTVFELVAQQRGGKSRNTSGRDRTDEAGRIPDSVSATRGTVARNPSAPCEPLEVASHGSDTIVFKDGEHRFRKYQLPASSSHLLHRTRDECLAKTPPEARQLLRR